MSRPQAMATRSRGRSAVVMQEPAAVSHGPSHHGAGQVPSRRPRPASSPMMAWPAVADLSTSSISSIAFTSTSTSTTASPRSARPFPRLRMLGLSPMLVLVLVSVLLFGGTTAAAIDKQAIADADRHSFVPVPTDFPFLIDTSFDIPLLAPRQNNDKKPSSTASPSATPTTQQDVPIDTSVGPEPLPSPFDAGFGANFTDSCSKFLNNFVSDIDFQDCHPLSLLLRTSSSFFTASKSFVRVTQALDATCNVDKPKCLGIMDSLAQAIKQDNACGSDLRNNNPMVAKAYNGFIAYVPILQAGCQRDESSNYCYANAITNMTATGDPIPYHLAIGVDLPVSARPTCNKCLQNMMGIYAGYANNKTQPLSRTYNPAAEQINILCGPSFISSSIPVLNAARSLKPGTSLLAIVITLVVLSLVLP